MSTWWSCHIHYTDVDRLLVECVHPFFRQSGGGLERRFHERHYAGGPHLRVRLRGEPAVVERVGGELEDAARRFLSLHPSAPLERYSEARAAELLEREGGRPDEEDLRYRNNVVERHPYPPAHHTFVSDEAAELSRDFRHDIVELVERIVTGERPRSEALLRLYFLQALLVCEGDLPRGIVSSKSHWEGFASTFPAGEVLERVRGAYERNREPVRRLMLEVVERYERGTTGEDPVLAAWHDLLARYWKRTREILASGKHLTGQPSTPGEAARLYEGLQKIMLRDSAFVHALWSNAPFLATIQHDPGFLVPRVLTNLLYVLVSSVGVNPLDRMALCYFSHRAAEEHFGCDLNDILEESMSASLAAHGRPWAP